MRILTICLGFSKALDTVSLYRLLVKMKNLGISKKNSKYRKILFDWTMKIKMGNNYRETQNISSGAPYD